MVILEEWILHKLILKKRIMMYEIEVLKQLKQNCTISFEEI